jgi:hypothetical protein
MQGIMGKINSFQPYVMLGLILAVLLLAIILLITIRSIKKLESKYKRMMRGVDNKNLEELILGYMDKIDEVKENTEYMKQINEKLDNKIKNCIQKVAVIRYRAFEDVGSDLSFSVALLDENNSGVILTGIYGRNESTTYSKPIDRGISRYDLSQEEKQVLQQCVNRV